MPAQFALTYDRWSASLDNAFVMATAAELHGLITGLLSAGLTPNAKNLLPVLYDFLNDGQTVPAALKSDIQQLIDSTATSLAEGDYSFNLLLPSDDDSLAERVEAMVEWAQAFLVGFAVQQTDLSLVSADVREAIEQLTEVTKVDIHTSGDASAAENEEAYYMVLEHIRMMVFCCFNEVGQKFPEPVAPNKTLH